ncbi:MAG: glycosyltransferase family 2 protein [Candidatus Makaraimicrobium thalassicum]|nr:MAG: glycosyltransferase family 2 protein [Candidatus Omnitrophota bacterium]
MKAQIFFSVIIPTFNRRAFLETAVNSVLAQTFRNLELIVVDDGSTDGTKELMSSCEDKRIVYFHQSNHGVSHARNRGLELTRGDFIAFLDSDDRWNPEKLEKTAEYIKNFQGISIFHTEEIWYRRGKLLNHKKKHKKPSGRVYRNTLPLCCISISTAVIKKDVFDTVGTFDETLEACEDYDFWLRAASRYEVKLIPEALTIKDGGRSDQLSSSIWGLDRFRIKALRKMLCSGLLNAKDHKITLEEFKKKCAIFAAGAEKRKKTKEAEYYRTLAAPTLAAPGLHIYKKL